MNWLRLLEGPAAGMTLPLAPTMPHVTYRGEKYFRMPDARSGRHPNSRGVRTEYGGAYLWDGWWGQMLEKVRQDQEPGDPRPHGMWTGNLEAIQDADNGGRAPY